MVKNQGAIWLELRFLGRSSVFEMVDGGRPLGIGSGLCSDLRIDGVGVEMVHLELVRSGDVIWLVPRTAGDVRLNAAHIGRPCGLPLRAVVEFLEHEIEILIHPDSPPSFCWRVAAEEVPPATLGVRWNCSFT